MSLNTAVVGAGKVSGVHLPGIQKNPRTNLVGVCDVDPAKAQEASNRYETRAYTDVDELLADESLDWLHVCTPVQTHFDIAKKAIAAGVPLLIEKPVTETAAEVEELARLASQNGVPISPVHQHLFRPAVHRAREMIQSDGFGKIRAVDLVYSGNTLPDEVNRGSWVFELPGGEFEEGLPHPIYTTLGLGGYPRDPSAINVSTSLAGEYDRPFDYDSVQVQYTTADDVLCSAKVLAGGIPKRQITVHGEERTITIDNHLQMIHTTDSDFTGSTVRKAKQAFQEAASRITGVAGNARFVISTQLSGDWDTEKMGDAHYHQFDRTAIALETGSEMPVPISSAEWTIRIMDQIRAAAAGEIAESRLTPVDSV